MKKTLFFTVLELALVQMAGAQYNFRLRNILNHQRNDVVEVNIPANVDVAKSVLLTDEGEKASPFETVGTHTIRFQPSVPKAGTMGYMLKAGNPEKLEKLTQAGIKLPGKRSDIMWENDRSAYRLYSTLLLKKEPNTGNGVDMWVKKKPTPIIDSMFLQPNYHNENEFGADIFSVNGKRLGMGGITHVMNGKLMVHGPYDECEVLENGALRSAFRVTYNEVEVEGVKYTKTVEVETRAGSLLNKATVCYTPLTRQQKQRTIKLAVGLYQHTDMEKVQPHGMAYTSAPGIIGWAEDKSEGAVTSPGARFYQGACIVDTDTRTEQIDHHLCLTADYEPGTAFTYYFGGGWNIFPGGEFHCDEDWFAALDAFAEEQRHPLTLTSWTGSLPLKNEVRAVLDKVNIHWQSTHPTHGDHFWNRAVYHTGNMAAYAVTGDRNYLKYSLEWAEHNKWMGQTGTDKTKWIYSYGEKPEYVLFGDNQICFQVYADLYRLLGGEEKIARAREVMEYQMSTPQKDYWWWVDGFYMVMPVMTKLYAATGNPLYLEKLHEYWKWGDNLMWDKEEHLYYRDGNYVYPAHKTSSGGKDFWARGDGWMMAALPRVLAELPAGDKYRDEYIETYRQMAEALRKCQRTDEDGRGYWCRSLLEEAHAPGYETSGTALITFGMLWGVNNGLLDDAVYGGTIRRAWRYLTQVALQSDGSVGYVQPIGSNAAPGTYVTAKQTADFGVGAFLLACSEMLKYVGGAKDSAANRDETAFSGYKVSDEGAWCWFADPRALHYENAKGSINATWIGYIDHHGNIKATQTDWKTKRTSEVMVRSWFQPDDHDNPAFLVLPDERVMIIYSRHTDEPCFYYRISKRPGDITTLGEEKRLPTEHNTTYPNPFILADDPDHIYMCWRGTGWHPTVAQLSMPDAEDNISFTWGPCQMVQSTGARPYAKYMADGKNKIYVAYTTGHPDNENPNWLYCNVFDITDKGLYDVKGRKLANVQDGPFKVEKTEKYRTDFPATVVDAAEGKRDWIWNMALDTDGQPAIGLTRISSDKQCHQYYYAKWTEDKWKVNFIANGGTYFHHSPKTENCYSAGMAIDRDCPNTVYCSIPVNGVHEIWKYTLDGNGKVAQAEAVTRNSAKTNARPFVIEGTKGAKGGADALRLTWMNGDYYYWIVNKNYPKAYPTAIVAECPMPENLKTTKGTTLEADLTIKADNYEGDILSSGNVTFGVDGQQHAYVKVGDQTYTSQNVLGTADSWSTENGATTDGKWYGKAKLGYFRLTMTSDGKFLTVYIDGVIDQRIACQAQLGEAKASDKMKLYRSKFTGKCLGQSQIKRNI